MYWDPSEPVLVTPPSVDPVSAEDIRSWLISEGIDSAQDGVIDSALKEAVGRVEKNTGLSLLETTWKLTLDCWPGKIIYIWRCPLIEVLSIKYIDTDGDQQTLAVSEYQVDTTRQPARVYLKSTPTVKRDLISTIEIEFKSGYAAGKIPADLILAVKMYVAMQFEHREDGPGTKESIADDICFKHSVLKFA